VLPKFVVIRPTSVPAEGKPFRGFRYLTDELLGRAEENSPAIGNKFGAFAGRFNGFWTKLAGIVPPGTPAWDAINWILFRGHERTPQSMILYRLRIIAQAVEGVETLHAEAHKLIGMVE
jgi:hypothetical protein